MAISTPTSVLASGSASNLSTYDTAVTVLTSGRLYLLTFANYKSATPAVPTTVTHDPVGTPLSFTLITDGTDNASRISYDSAAHRAVSVWYVIPGSTTASALIRITGMGACSAAGWSLTEITSGFNATGGATTFPGVATNSATQTSAIAVTMAAYANTNNLTYLAMAWGDGTANPAETIVATESRTELEEHNDTERQSLGSHYQNPNGSDTSIGATLSAAAVDWAAIGIEIAATSNDATGTAALTVPPVVAATGTQTFTSTSALALVITMAATGLVANPVTGTAALDIVPTVSATGVEKFTGTAALDIVPVLSATGVETFTGTATLTIAPTVAATGTETFTSTATITVVPTIAATGVETFTSTAALDVVSVVAATGVEKFTGTAALDVIPVVAGTASQAQAGASGTAALTITLDVAGTGVVLTPVSGTVALSITLDVVGAAYEPLPGTQRLVAEWQWEQGTFIRPGVGRR
jgi:hypothetical protein